MLVRVVVRTRAVLDVPARMTALDLDRRVSDGEPIAQALLEVAHKVLGVAERAIIDHDVGTQGHRL